jgi:hypothetical protein
MKQPLRLKIMLASAGLIAVLATHTATPVASSAARPLHGSALYASAWCLHRLAHRRSCHQRI